MRGRAFFVAGVVLTVGACGSEVTSNDVPVEADPSGRPAGADIDQEVATEQGAVVRFEPLEGGGTQLLLGLLALSDDEVLLTPGVDVGDGDDAVLEQAGPLAVVSVGREPLFLDQSTPPPGTFVVPMAGTRLGGHYAVLHTECVPGNVARMPSESWYSCGERRHALSTYSADGRLEDRVDVSELVGAAWAATLGVLDGQLVALIQPASSDDGASMTPEPGALRVVTFPISDDGTIGSPDTVDETIRTLASQGSDQACVTDGGRVFALASTVAEDEIVAGLPLVRSALMTSRDANEWEFVPGGELVSPMGSWLGCTADGAVVIARRGAGDDVSTLLTVDDEELTPHTTELPADYAPMATQSVPLLSRSGVLWVVPNDMRRQLDPVGYEIGGGVATRVEPPTVSASGPGMVAGRFVFDGERVWTFGSSDAEEIRVVATP